MKWETPIAFFCDSEIQIYFCDGDDFDDYFVDIPEQTDFSEYLWMENQDEFDRIEMQRLLDEHNTRECMAAMQDDESALADMISVRTAKLNAAITALPKSNLNVVKSVLNPEAVEFIPMNRILDNWVELFDIRDESEPELKK